MAKNNVIGICRLCRKRKKLCKSHYVGRAFYKLSTDGGYPVVITPHVVMNSPRQIWAHLLCEQCEERLNKFGETPVLKLVDNGKHFPLLERMSLSLNAGLDDGAVRYSGNAMGVNTDALAHFGLGFLWKGSCMEWKTLEKQTTTIGLGSYEKRIRQYLLGKTQFPSGVAIIVTVCEDRGSRGMMFAPSKIGGLNHTEFSILVRGIRFVIIVDDKQAPRMAHKCCVQSERRYLFATDCSRELDHAMKFVYKTLKRKG